MKKLKYILIALMIVLIGVGLYFAGRINQTNSYSKQEFILDTTCSATFYGDDAEIATTAVFEEIRRIEKLMDLYDESSDVSRINKAKANEKIKVSPDTYNVLKTALEISEKSGGAFDITIAPVTTLWNFGEEKPKVPAKENIQNALEYVGWENIDLKEENTIIKKKDDVKIDLGGAAKGYAGDCALGIAKEYKLIGGIIDFGGNIICFGENPNSKNGKWTVGIQVPFKQTGTYERTIELNNGTVVTSGTYQRYFVEDSGFYHHIIDPETGYPARKNYNSVTVVGNSSLEADCLATAVYILGKENGDLLAEKHGVKVYYE